MAGKRFRFSDDVVKLVANLYKVLCREKTQQNLVISLDRVFERSSNYVGLSRNSVMNILKNSKKAGGVSKLTPKFKPGKKVILDSFDKGIINRKIQSM